MRYALAAVLAAFAAGLGALGAPAAAQSSCFSATVKDTPEDQIRLYTICLSQGLNTDTRAAAHNNRGVNYLAIGEIDKALEDFSNAILYDDDWGQAYLNRARVYAAKGERALAEADLNRVVRLRPARIRGYAYLMRAELLALRGDREGALSDIAEATRLARRDPGANNDIAWFLATFSDPAYRNGAEAVRLAERAVARAEDSFSIRDTLAAAYAEAGRFDDAVREQTRVVEEARSAGADTQEFVDRLALYQSGRAFHAPPEP